MCYFNALQYCVAIKNYYLMQGAKQDIEIDESITYSLASETFSKSLKLHNKSSHIYVFKIKTNQRSVISMQLTHDFIKPNTIKEITIKLAEKPAETTPLRLEFNYAVPSEQEIRANDSKMNSYGRDAVFKRIITISRDDSVNPISTSTSVHLEKVNESGSQVEYTNLSNMSSFNRDSKKEQIKEDELKVQRKQEKKEEPKSEKKVQVPPFKYPELSVYAPRQVDSEQITIMTGKSAEINVADLIIEAPISSEEAIKVYQQPITASRLFEQTLKSQTIPVIVIPSEERTENFSYANSSPITRKSASNERISFSNSTEKTLKDLNEKLEREKNIISKLKHEQSEHLRSDCVYPVPAIYALVLLAFLSGSLFNWIVV